MSTNLYRLYSIDDNDTTKKKETTHWIAEIGPDEMVHIKYRLEKTGQWTKFDANVLHWSRYAGESPFTYWHREQLDAETFFAMIL